MKKHRPYRGKVIKNASDRYTPTFREDSNGFFPTTWENDTYLIFDYPPFAVGRVMENEKNRAGHIINRSKRPYKDMRDLLYESYAKFKP